MSSSSHIFLGSFLESQVMGGGGKGGSHVSIQILFLEMELVKSACIGLVFLGGDVWFLPGASSL